MGSDCKMADRKREEAEGIANRDLIMVAPLL